MMTSSESVGGFDVRCGGDDDRNAKGTTIAVWRGVPQDDDVDAR